MRSHTALLGLKRIGWPLIALTVSCLIAGIVGMSHTNFEVIVFKFLIFCPSLILVHLSRKMMFPYIDLRNYVDYNFNAPARTSEGQGQIVLGWYILRSAVVLGVFLYYVVLTYALTQAI